MIHAVILICAATLAPADCTRETALDVIKGPDVADHVSCMKSAQYLLVEYSRPLPNERVLIRCEGG